MLLPARTDELSLDARHAQVTADMQSIADEAVRQNELNTLAQTAADAVVNSLAQETSQLPWPEMLQRLQSRKETAGPRADELAASMMQADDAPKHTIGGTSIARDVLQHIHPDRTDTDGAFQRLTHARDTGNTAQEQGLYAAIVTKQALDSTDDQSIEDLELARYKAWIALQASRGNFDSPEAVEAWRDRELAALPYGLRVAGAARLFNEFVQTGIGTADQQDGILVPDDCHRPLLAAERAITARLTWGAAAERTPKDYETIDTTTFDERLTQAVELAGAILGAHSNSPYWSGVRVENTNRVLRGITEACRSLEMPVVSIDYSRIATTGLAAVIAAERAKRSSAN